MNFSGIIIGLCTFLIIGIFHPIVIKSEYYLGKQCWWMFMILGIAASVASLFMDNTILSTLAGVTAFSAFWSILELHEQEQRVAKSWFPANPKRKQRTDSRTEKIKAGSGKETAHPGQSSDNIR